VTAHPTSRWRSPALVFLFFTLLALGLTMPLVTQLTHAVPNDIGDPLLNTWILAWNSHALLTAPTALFNANIFYPLPDTLAYSEHLFSTGLVALPLQLVTAEPVAAYNLSLLLAFILSAFNMYLLALHWTHRRGAAIVAGLIFGFAPYRLAAVAHLQLLTFQWLPLALLFLDRLVAHPRPGRATKDAALLALFLVLQFLASWYLAVYSVVILGVYLLFRVFRLRQTGQLLAAATIVTLLVMPFTLPYLRLAESLRAARPLSQALSLAAVPTDFLAAAPFNRFFGPLTQPFRQRIGFTEENTLFLGAVPLLLAIIVIVRIATRKKNSERLLTITLIALFLLALGLTFAGPYAVLADLFPPATLVRVPPRWVIPALFALAGLAAIALRSLPSRWQTLLPGVVAGLLLVELFSTPLPMAVVENRRSLNPAYHWLAAQPDTPRRVVVELPLHSAPAPEFPEVKRLYASTLGWWRLVNGYSGYTPPRQPELAAQLAQFPSHPAIAALQALTGPAPDGSPTRLYLLVHPGEAPLDRTRWETADRWVAARNPALRLAGIFDGDYLYQVRQPEEPPAAPTLATFDAGQTVALVDAMLEPCPVSDGDCRQLTLFWQSPSPLAADVTVFVHLRAPDGFVRAQADGPPVAGSYPTSSWLPDEIIQDVHVLPSLPGEPADHLAIGLYDPVSGERLPAFGPDGARLPEDALRLALP
jgi:hypothetical protein